MDEFTTPAKALRRHLTIKGVTSYQLAKDTILPASRISEILSGKRRVTAETATVLGAYFENGAEYWLGLQSQLDINRSNADDATRWEGRGDLSIGGFRVRCYVTPDERRLISLTDFQVLFGLRGRNAKQTLSELLNSPYLKSQKMNALRKQVANPIRLIGPDDSIVLAYEGELIVEYCKAIMDVRRVKGLPAWAERHADAAEIIITSVAKVGIAALIDEATGYQSKRHRDALQKLLEGYFKEEIAAWSKRFPDWFYEEMFRLKGWEWDALSHKRPPVVGKVTRDIVYARLESGVIEELEQKNPLLSNGKRRVKHHQWLSDEIGHPALEAHFYALKGLMRAHHDWPKFYHTLQLAFPMKNEQIQLLLDDYTSDDD